MKTVFLVKDEEAALARAMEKKLLDLPVQSGIVFVGITVEPAIEEGKQSIYKVWIGCCRDLPEKLMKPLVEVTLRDEIAGGAIVQVEAHRGVGRLSL